MNRDMKDLAPLVEVSNSKPLSLTEAAKFLNCSESQVYKLTHRNLIPFYKPTGKLIYFKREELEEWVYKNRIRPKSEIEIETNNYVTLHKK